MRILGREAHAEIKCEPNQKDALERTLAQIARKSCRRRAIVLEKGGIGIDGRAKPLAQHECRVRNLEVLAEFGAHRALDAMVRPEYLRSIGERDRLERFSARMRGRERSMAARMPILCEYDIPEALRQTVDDRYHLVAARDREAAARAEIVLDIDDQQNVVFADRQ